MRELLAIALLVVPLVANAGDPKWKWTKMDTAFQAAAVGFMVADWGQTSWMMKQTLSESNVHWQNPDGTEYRSDNKSAPEYAEINPILGDHPGRGKINTYFIGIIAGHTAIARLLPRPYRRIWQAIYIAAEAGFVAHNFSMGARIEF